MAQLNWVSPQVVSRRPIKLLSLSGKNGVMARIWKGERSAPPNRFRGGSPMGGGDVSLDRDVPPPIESRHEALDPGPAYFVHVCDFTFEFWSVEQIAHALDYFEQEHHSSGRLPMDWNWRQEMIAANPTGWREAYDSFVRSHHHEMQRWFQRLPKHLTAKNKRPRVVAALQRALAEFQSDIRDSIQ